MKTLVMMMVVLATNLMASTDAQATKRVFGPFSEADRLVVLARLVIEKREPRKTVDAETGQDVYFTVGTLIACPDYTLFFYRGDAELGTIGLVGVSTVKARGEKEDQWLAEQSCAFLRERFGLEEDPRD
ncbi:MAG: hypothetical protein NTV51_12675 [Verrucomicrobia bacterium]|nr:hypothetical protein [Verrucomicrobiota bacterium]